MIPIVTFVHALIALHVATLTPAPVAALPITSKPIESTAENLAWQAWLMLPPEQKNLEKSRKVTPKSIFTLPFRDCPPGHQLFESRCIPTVSVDQTQLLTQQLLGFVVGDNAGGANYEFDYDDSDGGGEEEAMLIYEPTQKLSGEAPASYDDASQLPIYDAPLKFNIFQQKFPTDYEAVAEGEPKASLPSANKTDGAPASSDGSGMFNATQFLDAVNGYLQRQSNRTSDNNATAHSSLSGSIAIGGIDAIAVPAVASSPAASHVAVGLEPPPQAAPHKFSLFKDDSAVQLVTTGLTAADGTFGEEVAAATQSEIAQLLKVDALLPLFNVTQTAANAAMGSAGDSAAVDSAAVAQTEDQVTAAEDEAAVEDTTLNTPPDDSSNFSGEKDERPRSVSERPGAGESELGLGDLAALAAQEATFTTTIEPESTTNIQLDETTIIETHDSPTNAVQELLQAPPRREPAADADAELSPLREAAPEQALRENHVVLKKSKVEPVLSVAPTMTPLPSVTATVGDGSAAAAIDDDDDADAKDRFFNRHWSGGDGDGDDGGDGGDGDGAASMADDTDRRSAAESNEIVHSSNKGVSGTGGADGISAIAIASNHNKAILMDLLKRTAAAATTAAMSKSTTTIVAAAAAAPAPAPSEIDIAAEELRIINELVKGNRQQQQPEPEQITTVKATKATIAKETPTATAIKTEKTTTTTTTTTIKIPTASTTTRAESRFTTNETEETKATTPTTPTTITTTTRTDSRSALNKKVETSDVDGDASDSDSDGVDDQVTTSKNTTPVESSSISALSTTVATTRGRGEAITKNEGEVDAALWPKIMPILDFGAKERIASEATAATAITPATPPLSSPSPAAPTTAAAIPADVGVTSTADSVIRFRNGAGSNRSNRNSKISRLGTSTLPASKLSTTTTTIPVTPSTAVRSTDESTSATTTTTTTTTSGDLEPFWWLPQGWRLDRNIASVDSQPLLLRLWSAFPGNQSRVERT